MTICPTNGTHEAPPVLELAFPWIGSTPDMAKALSATWDDCHPCMDRHRSVVTQHHTPLSQGLYLWLASMSVTRHDSGLPPVASADGMLDAYPMAPPFSEATLALLRRIALTTETSPEGREANRWDPVAVDELASKLAPEDRERAWIDLTLVLTGWLAGTARAHADDQAGVYPQH